MYNLTNISKFSTVAMLGICLISCVDDNSIDGTGADEFVDKFKGEKIIFTAGTTNNSVITRADAKTYYMSEGGHFVCRMYHKNQADNEDFDVNTPEDAWLMVNNTIGNSVFWNKEYNTPTTFDAGNDADATYLYWRNRRPHAFLAWTDNNRLKSINYSSGQGGLKFSPYDTVITTNEKKNTWFDTGYQIYGITDDEGADKHFTSWAELKSFVENLTDEELIEFRTIQNGFNEPGTFGKSYYEYGWSCKYFESDQPETKVDNVKTSAWIKYLMYYEKYEYSPTGDEIVEVNKDDLPIFLKNANGDYLAEIVFDANDEKHLYPHYYITDIHGNVLYNEERPKYTFYMKRTSELKEGEIHDEYRANKFDLTRGEKTSMSQQPDILQALVIKEPASATLQANRIDLYFRHQFSQIQVNIKNSEDNSVEITSDQIDKVELLGVTDEGYVFTELLPNGEVRPTSYKDVVATDYTDAQLQDNPYGTKFNMFDRTMTEEERDVTKAIRSFECITFGLLQAIRITWHEEGTEDNPGTQHEATYRVGDTDLRNLKSGVRYIWNMELRRGTLAVVRTEVIPWIENQEDYSTQGTISKTN